LAVNAELQLTLGDGGSRVGRLRLGLPRAPVPDDDVAGAVLLRRDDPFEVEVLDRVILDVDGHPALPGSERGSARHGPRHEDAADLEPEVVMEARRPVTLHDEAPAAGGSWAGGAVSRSRFGGLPE